MSNCYQQRFIPNNPRTWCAEQTVKLHIRLISAEKLPEIRHFGKMKVYAEVSLNGTNTIKTKVDKERETNPTWDFCHDYTVNLKEASALTVKLYCDRTRGDKCIGTVQIPINSYFQTPETENVAAAATYDVVGTPHGKLKLKIQYTTSHA
ncbi:hypothetical protein C2S53_006080 [Perilla frutescens var. hirtella]|uniref:C2 domain-containing protein n=1 Tax=Perilla frutescens var. hirtella TaxID=608512 RepID=A0AAD4JGQ7_PERFH|nr:hypothetical protein C2S53_006080 [Perilla frutescens var. hirtella]